MRNAWNAFFSALTTLFSAADKGAKMLDNFAGIGEQTSRIMLQESELEGNERLEKIRLRIKEQSKVLEHNPEPTA